MLQNVDICQQVQAISSMSKTQEQQVLDFISTKGIIQAKELQPHGWARACLQRLEGKGLIERIGRGLYTVHDANVSERRGTAEICKRVPGAVVCLLSALQFHKLTTQLPFEVWIAIDARARKPAIIYPPLRVVRFSGAALKEGVQSHLVEGVLVKVYSPAKTVADCFKFRNKIGLDVAIEALRECIRKNVATVDEIWHYAQVCRVSKVMQPYMQAIL